MIRVWRILKISDFKHMFTGFEQFLRKIIILCFIHPPTAPPHLLRHPPPTESSYTLAIHRFRLLDVRISICGMTSWEVESLCLEIIIRECQFRNWFLPNNLFISCFLKNQGLHGLWGLADGAVLKINVSQFLWGPADDGKFERNHMIHSFEGHAGMKNNRVCTTWASWVC